MNPAPMNHHDRYANYQQLAEQETEGRDYRRVVRTASRSHIAIIAPHGGGIEPRTAGITRALARDEFNLYLFEGIKPRGNKYLHVTSRHFDEPCCLELIARCDTVIAIHGCKAEEECIFLGGLNCDLKRDLAAAMRNARLRVETQDHKFPALDPDNICNRGRSGAGVQVEISGPLRRSSNLNALVIAMRSVLAQRKATFRTEISLPFRY